jgi:hypothetical protein
MPKGSEEKRGRGLFEAGPRVGKRQTVRERRIARAKAKKPFDVRVRQGMALDSPRMRLKGRETMRRVRRALRGKKK